MERFFTRVLDQTTLDGEECELITHIHSPEEDEREGGDWECSFSIEGPEISLQKTMYGIDSIQALMHAIMGLDAHLKHMVQTTGAKITWLGMDDLGFSFPMGPDK